MYGNNQAMILQIIIEASSWIIILQNPEYLEDTILDPIHTFKRIGLRSQFVLCNQLRRDLSMDYPTRHRCHIFGKFGICLLRNKAKRRIKILVFLFFVVFNN